MTNLIICTTQRSGSTFLCDNLRKTGVLGYPEEWLVFLEYDFENLDATQTDLRSRELREIVRYQSLAQQAMSRQSTTAWKIMWSTMRVMKRYSGLNTQLDSPDLLDNRSLFELLTTEINQPKFIFFERQDKVAQAISHVVLQRTQVSHVRSLDEEELLNARKLGLTIADEEVTTNIRDLLRDEREWEDFFATNAITPLRLTYEQLVVHPNPTLDRIQNFLGNVNFDFYRRDAEHELKPTSGDFERSVARAYIERLINSGMPS